MFRVSRKSAATEAVLRPFFKKRRRLPCLPWDYGRGKDWKRRRPRQGKKEGTSYFGLIPPSSSPPLPALEAPRSCIHAAAHMQASKQEPCSSPSALSHTKVGRIFSGANVAVIIHDGGGEGEQCSAAPPPLSARPRPPPPPLLTYSNGGGDEDGG